MRAFSAAVVTTLALVSCRGSSGAVPSPPEASVSSAEAPDSSPKPSASSAASGAPTAAVPAAPAGIPKDLSVLVISIDSLRADMPWNGYARPIAPRLTELEKKSVSYTHAYSISSYTSMSLGGFLGGKLPSEMKRSGYFFGTYPSDDLMFPELLHDAGIRTLSAHAHGYFKSAGFNQGFDKYEIVPDILFNNETDPNVTGPQHEAIAERLLSDPELATKRFFAWFHFLDPHDRYMPHDKDGIPPYGKTLRDRYDGEVTFTDVQIGKLLDFLDKQPYAKKLAIVVTADHGEAFGEHGQYNHGFELWENLVRVPLFFYVPGATPRHIDVPRSGLDLAPTIFELLGVAPDPGFEGHSLVKEIEGGAAEERDVVCDLPMTSDNDKRRALIHGRQKIIAFGKDEITKLFDLDADPGELHPITSGDTYKELTARYRAFSKTVKEVAPTSCREGCLNREYANKK